LNIILERAIEPPFSKLYDASGNSAFFLPVNTMDLKNMLCQIKANSCNVHFGRLSRLTG